MLVVYLVPVFWIPSRKNGMISQPAWLLQHPYWPYWIIIWDFLTIEANYVTILSMPFCSVKERTPVIMPYIAPVLPNEGENWDCDEPVQTYDPTAKNINFKVLRGLQGASKSERKHHRAQERLRFNAVAENGGWVLSWLFIDKQARKIKSLF